MVERAATSGMKQWTSKDSLLLGFEKDIKAMQQKLSKQAQKHCKL